MRVWNVKWGFDGIDIGRKSDFLLPDGTASMDTYVAGFDKGDAERVSKAVHDNLAGKPFEYFKVPAEYNRRSRSPSSTTTGQPRRRQALDGVAEQWKVITDRLGVDSQKEAYAFQRPAVSAAVERNLQTGDGRPRRPFLGGLFTARAWFILPAVIWTLGLHPVPLCYASG